MAEYIDREAALNIVNDWREQLIPIYGKNDEYVKCLETVAEYLELLHAADVRPVVRGKWERTSKSLMVCTACGNCVVDDRISSLFFCPNCGADNREES